MTLEEAQAVVNQFVVSDSFKPFNFRFVLNPHSESHLRIEMRMDVDFIGERPPGNPAKFIYSVEYLEFSTMTWERLVSHLYEACEEAVIHELQECFSFAGMRPKNPHDDGVWERLKNYRVCGGEALAQFEIPEAEVEEFEVQSAAERLTELLKQIREKPPMPGKWTESAGGHFSGPLPEKS